MRVRKSASPAVAIVFLVALGVMASSRPVHAQTCAPIPAGLVSWWKLEGSALDLLGSNNGALVGGSFEAAEVGQGYRPAGLGSLVQVPDNASLNPTTFTVDLWAKIDYFPVYNAPLVWKGQSSGADKTSPFGIGIYGTTEKPAFTGFPFGIIGNGTVSQEVRGGAVVPLGTFFHIAETADGTTLSLYLNGILVDSAPLQLVPGASTNDLQLGGVAQPGALNMLPGVIDEVEIHNQAATAAQILAIYLAGPEGKCLTTRTGASSWGQVRRSYR